MIGKLHIVLLLILIPFFSWSNDDFVLSPDIMKPPNETVKPNSLNSLFYDDGGRFVSFNHRAFLSFGLRNFMIDYQATAQFQNWAEIGAGIGFHRNSVKFYSASDQHKISISSLPAYATVTLYPYHDDNRAFYVKGNYGFVNNLSGKKNRNDKSLKGNVMQVGVGYKQYTANNSRYWFVELSQYASVAKGTFKDPDTYKSETDYELQIYGIILSVGININR